MVSTHQLIHLNLSSAATAQQLSDPESALATPSEHSTPISAQLPAPATITTTPTSQSMLPPTTSSTTASTVMANLAQNIPPAGQAAAPAQAQALVAQPAQANGLSNLSACTERSAPSFNENRPQDLTRYFSDLQVLLDKNGIVDDQDKKTAALKYQQVKVENLWKTTRAWLNPNSTYKEFKEEIVKLYPGAAGNSTYLLQDLDAMIGHFTRIGIWSATDLGDYHRRFITITRYLISMNRLLTHDEARHFFCGLPPDLEDKVRGHLQLKLVDHLPDDLYKLDDIYEAATYVLRDASFLAGLSQQHHGAPAAKTTTTAILDPVSVKIEALTAVVATLTETVKTAIQGPCVPVGQSSSPGMASATGMSAPTNSACNFCGVPGHFIRECEIVAEYMRFSKCKRSHDGKVVLPSGAMVLKSIRGTWLRERIDEYH